MRNITEEEYQQANAWSVVIKTAFMAGFAGMILAGAALLSGKVRASPIFCMPELRWCRARDLKSLVKNTHACGLRDHCAHWGNHPAEISYFNRQPIEYGESTNPRSERVRGRPKPQRRQHGASSTTTASARAAFMRVTAVALFVVTVCWVRKWGGPPDGCRSRGSKPLGP